MRKTAILLALVVLGLTAAAPASAVAPGSTVLIDRPSGLGALPFDGQNNATLDDHSLSADSCFVVYASSSDDLLPTDDDSAANVYRQNRCAAGSRPVQVNTSATGAPAQADSWSHRPTISADGRFVAFHTTASNLHPSAGESRPQILVKDMQTGALELVSRGTGADGQPAQVGATEGVISGNGEVVVFSVTGLFDASNVDGAAGQTDLYVRFRASGETRMVSLTTGDTRGGGVAVAEIDHSGRNVAFTTTNRLDPAADTDNGIDAYLRRTIGQLGEGTRLVSFAGGGQPAGADSAINVAVAGGLVAYTNDAGAWLSNCPLACEPSARIDQPLQGGSNAAPDFDPYFAPGDGTPAHVYWTTRAPLAADPDQFADLYRAPVGGGPVSLMTAGAANGDVFAGSSTPGGAVVVFHSVAGDLPGTGGVMRGIFDRVGGNTRSLTALAGVAPRVPQASDAALPRLHAASDDGRFVVFRSRARGLGAPLNQLGSAVEQVFVRDVVTGETKLVSAAPDGSPQNAESQAPRPDPSIDAAGRRVVFPSRATNLVPGVVDGKDHVYMRDLATGQTTVVDKLANGSPTAQGADGPQISGDGTKVAFLSQSPDLPSAQAGTTHVFVADLGSGQVTLVDRATGGAVANASAADVDLSHDGSKVAFTSAASNLGGPATATRDVYVTDRATGRTTWASAPTGTPAALRIAGAPSLSRDGTRVVYTEFVQNNGTAVFLRDLAAGTTALVSEPNDRSGQRGVVSGDGTRVALISDGSPVLHVVGSSEFTRLDLRDGSSEPGRLYGGEVTLSGNGACALVASRSDDLVTPSYGPDYSHVFLRSLGPACAPAPAGGGGADGGPDVTAPVVGRARALPNRFAVAARRTPRSAATRPGRGVARGTRFAFTLSEAASTRIRIKGRRRGRALVLTRARTRAGANRVRFSGRVGRRVLRPGVYRATIVATDAAGNASKPARVRFRVVRG